MSDDFKQINDLINFKDDNLDNVLLRKANKLLACPQLLTLLEKCHLSSQDVRNNPFIFEDCLLENENNSDDCFEYLIEKRGEELYLIKVMTQQYQEVVISKQHLKNIRINHFEVFYKLSLSNLDTDDESESYLKLYNYLNKSVELEKLNNGSLFLYGDVGVGKTYLMLAFAHDLARKGYKIALVKCSQLVNDYRNLNDFESRKNMHDILKNVDFLLLDDIGSEYASEYGKDQILFPIVDYRMDHKLVTAFTSNYDFNELAQKYQKELGVVIDYKQTERLLERIKTLARPFKLVSNNKRHNNNNVLKYSGR